MCLTTPGNPADTARPTAQKHLGLQSFSSLFEPGLARGRNESA